jgi:hypothetical protein
MQAINQAVNALRIGEPVSYRNLTLFPLLSDANGAPGYLTLDEALEGKLAEVTEVSEGGSVPDLKFENRAEKDVLLLDGEELVGAKQNRILNLTVLVGKQKTVSIPVSCVERGRWSYRGRRFASGYKAFYSRGRAAKMAQVSRMMESTGTRRSDQGAIWHNIASKSARRGFASATEAMSDLYDKERPQVAEFEAAFGAADRQVGAVFALNGKVEGLEFFDAPATFAKFLKKLVGSYAMDAIDVEEERVEIPPLEAARAFVEGIKAAALRNYPAIGEGEDLRLLGEGIAGGALVDNGRVVHCAAFRTEGKVSA